MTTQDCRRMECRYMSHSLVETVPKLFSHTQCDVHGSGPENIRVRQLRHERQLQQKDVSYNPLLF